MANKQIIDFYLEQIHEAHKKRIISPQEILETLLQTYLNWNAPEFSDGNNNVLKKSDSSLKQNFSLFFRDHSINSGREERVWSISFLINFLIFDPKLGNYRLNLFNVNEYQSFRDLLRAINFKLSQEEKYNVQSELHALFSAFFVYYPSVIHFPSLVYTDEISETEKKSLASAHLKKNPLLNAQITAKLIQDSKDGQNSKNLFSFLETAQAGSPLLESALLALTSYKLSPREINKLLSLLPSFLNCQSSNTNEIAFILLKSIEIPTESRLAILKVLINGFETNKNFFSGKPDLASYMTTEEITVYLPQLLEKIDTVQDVLFLSRIYGFLGSNKIPSDYQETVVTTLLNKLQDPKVITYALMALTTCIIPAALQGKVVTTLLEIINRNERKRNITNISSPEFDEDLMMDITSPNIVYRYTCLILSRCVIHQEQRQNAFTLLFQNLHKSWAICIALNALSPTPKELDEIIAALLSLAKEGRMKEAYLAFTVLPLSENHKIMLLESVLSTISTNTNRNNTDIFEILIKIDIPNTYKAKLTSEILELLESQSSDNFYIISILKRLSPSCEISDEFAKKWLAKIENKEEIPLSIYNALSILPFNGKTQLFIQGLLTHAASKLPDYMACNILYELYNTTTDINSRQEIIKVLVQQLDNPNNQNSFPCEILMKLNLSIQERTDLIFKFIDQIETGKETKYLKYKLIERLTMNLNDIHTRNMIVSLLDNIINKTSLSSPHLLTLRNRIQHVNDEVLEVSKVVEESYVSANTLSTLLLERYHSPVFNI